MKLTRMRQLALVVTALSMLAPCTLTAGEPGPEVLESESSEAIEPPVPGARIQVAQAKRSRVNPTASQAPQLDRCETEGRLHHEACQAGTGADREQCLRAYDDAVNACADAGSPPEGNESRNIYRIPYADGTVVHVSRDFYDHRPKGRIDMHGKGSGTHRIVAAAAGTIRHIQDSRSKQQHPERWRRNTPDCFNNYVWIEHANHEWSKYSHMQMGTTSAKAGLKVGDKVAQGDYLGDEGNVGCAWPAHLHFQIVQVRADDTDPAIDPTHGGLTRYSLEDERNPRFSDLDGRVFTLKDGDNYVAGGLPTCRKDTECPDGYYCNAGLDLATNRCMPLKADNEACDLVGGGHQCKSGFCKFARCYTPDSVAMGGVCHNDDACSEGKCSAVDGARGNCVCKTDADCGSGKWCDAGLDTKVNACREKLGKGEKCGGAGSVGNDHK